MKQETFTEAFSPLWDRFEAWLALHEKRRKLGRRAEPAAPIDQTQNAESLPLGDDQIPQTYRVVCQHLAVARERNYSPQLVTHLSNLMLRGHQAIYGARPARSNPFIDFVFGDFPRAVRAEWRWVLTSAVLFFGPLIGLVVALQVYPDFAYTLLGGEQIEQFESMYDPSADRIGKGRDADSDVMMFGFYIWNNVKIAFQTFAGGALFGVGSVFFLVFNGVIIGGVAGHLTAIGSGRTFWSFVAGHSALELGAIVLSGAAGLKLGYALLAPGLLSRKAALAAAADPAVRIIGGAAGMLVMAAFVEAFWSSHNLISVQSKIAVGAVIGVLVAAYFSLAGRRAA